MEKCNLNRVSASREPGLNCAFCEWAPGLGCSSLGFGLTSQVDLTGAYLLSLGHQAKVASFCSLLDGIQLRIVFKNTVYSVGFCS